MEFVCKFSAQLARTNKWQKQSNVLMNWVVSSSLHPYCGLGTVEAINKFQRSLARSQYQIYVNFFFAFISNTITKIPDVQSLVLINMASGVKFFFFLSTCFEFILANRTNYILKPPRTRASTKAWSSQSKALIDKQMPAAASFWVDKTKMVETTSSLLYCLNYT